MRKNGKAGEGEAQGRDVCEDDNKKASGLSVETGDREVKAPKMAEPSGKGAVPSLKLSPSPSPTKDGGASSLVERAELAAKGGDSAIVDPGTGTTQPQQDKLPEHSGERSEQHGDVVGGVGDSSHGDHEEGELSASPSPVSSRVPLGRCYMDVEVEKEGEKR